MKKNNIDISLIIPVYNGEKYINRCLDSVINQTLNNFQTIIINDGSTDNSLKRIKKYEKKISNLLIVDKKNEGSWKARIDGVKNATGKYVTFMDVDDEIEPGFIETLYNTIKQTKSDISICGYCRIDNYTNKLVSKEMLSYGKTVINVEKDMAKLALINTSNWNKMYKKALFDKAINYEVSSISFEDLTLNVLAYINAKTIAFNDSCLYKYYVNPNSLMKSINVEHIEKLKNTFVELRNYIEKANTNMLPLIDFMAVMHLGFSINQRIYNSNCKNKKIIKDLCKYIKLNFPMWKKFKVKNLKLYILKIIFSLNLVYSFLKIYVFMINKLKIDIKW